MSVPDPDHKGHRARLRQRLLGTGGGDSLLDHEIVEYLLALAIPRRDTKPLAKELLRRFGGIGGLFAAEPAALMGVDGMGETAAAAIRIAQASAIRLLRAEVAERPVLANWQALLDYLRAEMAFRTTEHFRVLHLNTRNVLIADETMSDGTVDETAVHVREVIRRAMDLGSAALILVHNHPSGDPQPSRADIELTRKLADAAKRLNIAIHDHIVIGTSGHASLRAMGLV